jgi:hypothetical protein
MNTKEMKRDYYEILGVTKSASADEIKNPTESSHAVSSGQEPGR